jgi:hypothetical protein
VRGDRPSARSAPYTVLLVSTVLLMSTAGAAYRQ